MSESYSVLMGFRIVHGFGSSVCEALPAQAVADVFFLHERGKALGWYTCQSYYSLQPFGYISEGTTTDISGQKLHLQLEL